MKRLSAASNSVAKAIPTLVSATTTDKVEFKRNRSKEHHSRLLRNHRITPLEAHAMVNQVPTGRTMQAMGSKGRKMAAGRGKRQKRRKKEGERQGKGHCGARVVEQENEEGRWMALGEEAGREGGGLGWEEVDVKVEKGLRW
ncbi:hypothetical protein ACH5RR_003099 [Cinchona calisaya]|uniref:Uncharacterized protein n=1 Tax=Cinchona calisaya TaxID=153742 RepID=A0ABD3ATV2_9GENT